jgi:hypothetical protein
MSRRPADDLPYSPADLILTPPQRFAITRAE